MTSIGDQPIAVVVARAGELPLGADEAIAEAGGRVLVVGDGAGPVAESVPTARQSLVGRYRPGTAGGTARRGPGAPARAGTAGLAAGVAGRPRPRARGWPPSSTDRCWPTPSLWRTTPRPVSSDAQLARLDDRLTLAVDGAGPVVATLVPGVRSVTDEPYREPPVALGHLGGSDRADVEVVEVLEPDPATMDLADATRVVGGGAGLVRAVGRRRRRPRRLSAADRGRGRAGRVGRRDAGRHRRRVDGLRPADRHDRGDGRPRAVRRVRRLRREPAHRRARRAPARRERQHRPVVAR